jgi:hypothetical protein
MATPSLRSVFLVKEVLGFQKIIDRASDLGFRVVSVDEMKEGAPDAVSDWTVDTTPRPTPFGGTVTVTGDHGNTVEESSEEGRFIANGDFSKMAFFPDNENGHYYFWSRSGRAWDLDAASSGVPELEKAEGR